MNYKIPYKLSERFTLEDVQFEKSSDTFFVLTKFRIKDAKGGLKYAGIYQHLVDDTIYEALLNSLESRYGS